MSTTTNQLHRHPVHHISLYVPRTKISGLKSNNEHTVNFTFFKAQRGAEKERRRETLSLRAFTASGWLEPAILIQCLRSVVYTGPVNRVLRNVAPGYRPN